MAGEDNVAAAKRGYAAFSAGDAAAAMEEMADDIVWVVPGNSAISGTTHGKLVRFQTTSDTALLERVFGTA